MYIAGNLLIIFLAFFFIYRGYTYYEKKVGVIQLSIGTSLMAAGIVSIIELWRNIIKSKLLDKINNILFEAGIELIYKKRDIDKYDILMENLSKNLDITGYSLNAFHDSYADLLLGKVKQDKSIIVRILMVKPGSSFSTDREEIEKNQKGIYSSAVEKIKGKFRNCRNIKIKLLDHPISTMIFKIDNVMFIGPHFHEKTSKSTLTIELNKDGWMYEEYCKEFERMWADAEDI